MNAPHSAPSGFRIEQAMAVAGALKQRLLQDDPDLAADETILRDTLDGETDVYDLMRRLARFVLEAEAMEAAAKARATAIAGRQKRYAARAQAGRGALFGMMDALGEKTLTDPEFTASIKAGRASVFVTDESALPDDYVNVTRVPNKTAIADALKAGTDIPGAELGNGMPTLQIKGS